MTRVMRGGLRDSRIASRIKICPLCTVSDRHEALKLVDCGFPRVGMEPKHVNLISGRRATLPFSSFLGRGSRPSATAARLTHQQKERPSWTLD